MNHKVLQVIDTLHIGGAERVFVDISNLLADAGIEVTALFLLDNGPMSKSLNKEIAQVELNRRSKIDLKAMRTTARLMARSGIVHCHGRHVYRYMKLVQRIFRTRSEVILHDHFGSIQIDQSIPSLMKGFLRPNMYIGVSTALTDWAVDQLEIESDRVHLLENVIIPSKSKQVSKEDKRGMVLVSNIKPNKNQLFALEKFVDIGEPITIIGKEQDSEYFRQCCQAADSWTESTFLTNVDQVQPVLPSFKLGLHTSKSETGPLVLIEYLAQSLPFLSYETGEVAQLLKKEFPQYFISTFEVEAWKDRINELLNTEHDSEKMSTVFANLFSSSNYLNKCLAIYKNINN